MEKLKIEEEYAKSKVKVKILEAIESEDHKREFNVVPQYKGEMDKTIVGDGKSDFSLIKQPLH